MMVVRTATSEAPFYHSVKERLTAHEDLFHIPVADIDLYLQRNFLSGEECIALIEAIDAENEPSLVLGYERQIDFRSSDSSNLTGAADLVQQISQRIDRFLGIDPRFGEPIGGVRYAPGQEFKPHFDWIDPSTPYWPAQDLVGGQRTWSVIICLSQPESGGGTMFPEVGVRLHPRAGNLITWCNLSANGAPNRLTLHCGEPVEAGTKYILSKWYRSRPFTPPAVSQQLPASEQLKQLGLTPYQPAEGTDHARINA
jgi:prolyl 4-hydroxylase